MIKGLNSGLDFMRRKIQWDERGAGDKNDKVGVVQHVAAVVRKTVHQPAKVIAVLFYLFKVRGRFLREFNGPVRGTQR